MKDVITSKLSTDAKDEKLIDLRYSLLSVSVFSTSPSVIIERVEYDVDD